MRSYRTRLAYDVIVKNTGITPFQILKEAHIDRGCLNEQEQLFKSLPSYEESTRKVVVDVFDMNHSDYTPTTEEILDEYNRLKLELPSLHDVVSFADQHRDQPSSRGIYFLLKDRVGSYNAAGFHQVSNYNAWSNDGPGAQISLFKAEENETWERDKLFAGIIEKAKYQQKFRREKTKTDYDVSMVVHVGTGMKTGEEFLSALKSNNIQFDSWTESILCHHTFRTSARDQMVDLVVIPSRKLQKHGYELQDIYYTAQEMGLELCPPEIGPQFVLQQDIKAGKKFLLGMAPIDEKILEVGYYAKDEELENGKYLYRKGPFLKGTYGDVGFIHSGENWIFIRPKDKPKDFVFISDKRY